MAAIVLGVTGRAPSVQGKPTLRRPVNSGPAADLRPIRRGLHPGRPVHRSRRRPPDPRRAVARGWTRHSTRRHRTRFRPIHMALATPVPTIPWQHTMRPVRMWTPVVKITTGVNAPIATAWPLRVWIQHPPRRDDARIPDPHCPRGTARPNAVPQPNGAANAKGLSSLPRWRSWCFSSAGSAMPDSGWPDSSADPTTRTSRTPRARRMWWCRSRRTHRSPRSARS